MSQSPSRRRKYAMAVVKLAIVVVVLWAIRRTIVDAVQDLGDHTWQLDPAWVLLSAAVYLLGLLPAGLFWHRSLRVMGQDARLGETLRAYFIGHLGKYVPGKAMVVVIRTGLIRSGRVNTGVAAASVFFETLTMMSVGAFLAAAIIAVRFHDQIWLCGLALALMIAAGLPTIPSVFRQLARLAGVGKSDASVREGLQRLRGGTLALGWIMMTVSWLLLGASLWAALMALGVEPPSPITQWHLYTAAVSLAMVAGFLSLIPGGAVVREAILTELLVPQFGEATALLGAVLLRLVWLAAELVISAVLWLSATKQSRP